MPDSSTKNAKGETCGKWKEAVDKDSNFKRKGNDPNEMYSYIGRGIYWENSLSEDGSELSWVSGFTGGR